MVIGIDMGHPLNCGAFGIMPETYGNRLVGNELIRKLRSLSHTVINCTYDTNINELENRVAKANAQHLDYFISLHMDSFNNPSANGVTVFTTENSGAKTMANTIINLVAESCGYTNRGWKSANYYVLRNTIAPAMLIEMGFVSNQDDCNKFNAENIANAIVEGLTGLALGGLTVLPTVEIAPVIKTVSNNWIARLQAECNNQSLSNQVVDNVSGINTLSGCPVLRRGSKGNITALLQERLNSLGYSCGEIDSDFGNLTSSAVKQYQRDNFLGADSIVGRNTWTKLLGL